MAASILDNLSEELTSLQQFCVRYEKQPFIKTPKTGKLTASWAGVEGEWAGPEGYLTFSEARKLLEDSATVRVNIGGEWVDRPITGIGFMNARAADPERQIVGGDLDCCRNPLTGNIGRWAYTLLHRIQPFYVEVSPSQTGVRFFALGHLPEDVDSVTGYGDQDDLPAADREAILTAKPKAREKLAKGKPVFNGVELYVDSRHLTLTGDKLPTYCYAPEDRTNALSEALKDYLAEEQPIKKNKSTKKAGSFPPLNILQVIDTTGFEEHGGELVGPHPTEGSITGANLKVNPGKGVWFYLHDFKGGTAPGGDAWMWLACECGVVPWMSAGAGMMVDPVVIAKTMQHAANRGLIPETPDIVAAFRKATSGNEEPKGPNVIDAIRALAGVCDGAKSQDGMGFSKFDREANEDLIEKAISGKELSPKKEKKAYAFLKKYKKQLKGLGIDYGQIGMIDRDNGAAREDAGPTDSEQREIIVTNRHMQDITAESLPELVAYNNPPKIFVKAGYLVQIAVDEKEITRIELLSESALKSSLSRCARYMRIAGEDGELAATDAPGKVVKDMLALPNWPGILPIVGLISSPVVRPDGSIIDQPGHDAATGIFYTGNVGMALTVPDSPTQDEAVKAAAYIMAEVFGDFPFREQASRANTLAALLTTLTLPLIGGNIPLGLFDKPQAGTGASLLTEIIAELVTGEKANMQTAPDNDEEWRKAITAVLIQGPQIVVIDNVTSALKSSKLSQMLTARTWSDRMLGQTKMLNLPQTAAWFATGNNIQLGGDIARRAYWIRLDAASARPWLRDGFRHHDILAWVEEHRSELLSMLLMMVRAWVVAGKPKGIAPKLGSFVKWSQVIGGILTYAGIEGFLGNAAELYDSADQDIAQWDLFLDEWQKLHRDDKITSGMLKIELTDVHVVYKPFQSEMPEEIIKATDKGTRGAVGLGKALSRHADQVFPSGRKLTVEVDSHTKGKKWSVTTIKRSAVDAKGPEPQASDPFAVDAVDGLTPSPNQKENISGIEEREEKIVIIPERNGGRGGSTTASTAKRPDDIESGTLPSTANGDGGSMCGIGPHPRKDASKEDPGLQKFKAGIKKRHCSLCGRTFPHDLTPYFNEGKSSYICVSCHMGGAPVEQPKADAQARLGEVA